MFTDADDTLGFELTDASQEEVVSDISDAGLAVDPDSNSISMRGADTLREEVASKQHSFIVFEVFICNKSTFFPALLLAAAVVSVRR